MEDTRLREESNNLFRQKLKKCYSGIEQIIYNLINKEIIPKRKKFGDLFIKLIYNIAIFLLLHCNNSLCQSLTF